jgi:hypothetical protein
LFARAFHPTMITEPTPSVMARSEQSAPARRTAKSGVWYIFRPRRFTILDYSMTENTYLTPSP